jgi:hypothetical protein
MTAPDPAATVAEAYLCAVRREFQRYKNLADRALAQVDDAGFTATLDPGSNSLAIIVKHVAGNLRSRWRDFLTSDGEKPDRRRDGEFILEPGDTRDSLMARWEEGWRLLLDTIDALGAGDLTRTVYIRAEPHRVIDAIERQVAHYATHVGQIVFLAKHLSGDRWQSLSIPPGQSDAFNAAMLAGAVVRPGTIRVTDSDSGAELGWITEPELQVLIDLFEEESADDRTYYVNPATVDLLEKEGADPALVVLLKRALAGREEMEIRWERRSP